MWGNYGINVFEIKRMGTLPFLSNKISNRSLEFKIPWMKKNCEPTNDWLLSNVMTCLTIFWKTVNWPHEAFFQINLVVPNFSQAITVKYECRQILQKIDCWLFFSLVSSSQIVSRGLRKTPNFGRSNKSCFIRMLMAFWSLL